MHAQQIQSKIEIESEPLPVCAAAALTVGHHVCMRRPRCLGARGVRKQGEPFTALYTSVAAAPGVGHGAVRSLVRLYA